LWRVRGIAKPTSATIANVKVTIGRALEGLASILWLVRLSAQLPERGDAHQQTEETYDNTKFCVAHTDPPVDYRACEWNTSEMPKSPYLLSSSQINYDVQK
jgi:hypothetical protein